jgi:hypothetical protein
LSAKRRTATLASIAAAILSLAAGTAAAAGSPPAGPSISDLPALVRAGTGTDTLALAFVQAPTPSTLRVAVTAASAFAGLSSHGVTIESYIRPTQREILSSPDPVIEVSSRPGAPTLSARYLANGNLLVSLAGQGQSLLNAAKLLSTRWISALSSSSSNLPASLTARVAGLDTTQHGTENLAAGTVSGNGAVSISRQVSIPVQKVITQGQAVLRMGVEYNAPGGGRLTFKLNGWTLGSAHASGRGNTFVYRERIASVWTDAPNLQPGYYLNPGENTLTITAQPSNPQLAQAVGTQLALTTHSSLRMTLTRRRPQIQLDLWPFPVYNGSWNHTTVVMPAPSQLSPLSLSTLITALANTERLTGAAADPQITFSHPTAAQRRGNLLVYGPPESTSGLTPKLPIVPGLLSEQKLAHGGYVLFATDRQALDIYAATGYAPSLVNGQAAVVDADGQAHTLVGATAPIVFRTPKVVWLKPAGAIAAIILMWVAVRVYLARRRLRRRNPLPPGVIS